MPGILGLREEDWGGTFYHPSTPVLERGVEVFLKDWKSLGGDPYLPRRYRELLHRTGFASVRTSATAETREGDAARQWSEMAGAYMLAPATKKRVIDAGLADEALLENLRDDWARWGRNPDAFLSMTYCEVLALKAADPDR